LRTRPYTDLRTCWPNVPASRVIAWCAQQFGEEAFQHSKKKVQQRLEIVSRQTAGENAAHLGEEETMLTAANVLAEHMEKQATRVGEKMKDAGSWVSNKIEVCALVLGPAVRVAAQSVGAF